MRRIEPNPEISFRQKPTPVIRRRNEKSNYDNTKHLKRSSAQRYNIIEEAINENFVGKRIGVYCKDAFITGICEKYISGSLFLRKAHYRFMSEAVDLVVEGDTDFITIEKQGKSLVVLGEEK